MFELARVQTIGMTRRFDFARLALNFTDHTRFLFYITLASSFTICPYLLLKNFNALVNLDTISLQICMLFVTRHLLKIDNMLRKFDPMHFLELEACVNDKNVACYLFALDKD